LMRTADSVTPSLTTRDVALSLAAYVLCYLAMFGAGFVLLLRLVRLGPPAASAACAAGPDAAAVPGRRSARPLSAVSGGEAGITEQNDAA
ncbi:cytochrome ubiquinol oxidase subunit I, partial [Burkholderia thailandensis]|nr:cytochrome ubiquinol oxidase subunit I [Burkholderia thailandensis]